MKKALFFAVLLLSCLWMTSCTTYSFMGRQVDVRGRNIDMEEQMAGVVVDYSRTVTATSEYQLTKRDAIAEAEYKCIQSSKIDVVVDPMYQVEYNPFKIKMRYKATIVGFAGKYEQRPNKLDNTKQYSTEEIEKYKLLTDPNFPQYYYRTDAEGDNYFFNSPGDHPQPVKGSSVVIKNPNPKKAAKPVKAYDYNKAIQLRNGGCGLMAAGVVMALPIALPCYYATETRTENYTEREYSYNKWSGKTTSYLVHRTRSYEAPNESAQAAGIAFMVIGAASFVASIPMIAVGADRAKKAQKADVSLNVGGNGLGVKVTF